MDLRTVRTVVVLVIGSVFVASCGGSAASGGSAKVGATISGTAPTVATTVAPTAASGASPAPASITSTSASRVGVAATTAGPTSAAGQAGAVDASASRSAVVPGSATGQSACERSGPALSEGQSADGHGQRGKLVEIPVAPDDQAVLDAQQAKARAVIAQYSTVAAAEAAGYVRSTTYVPCIGAHYTNLAYAAAFDPEHPSELLFDGTAPTSKIVGLSYLVWHPGGAPDGFAGKNDHWHQHNQNGGLCLQGGVVVGGEDVDAAACTALGGVKRILQDVWMLHDWVAPTWQCTWGVFAGECPELGGKLGFDASA